VSPPQEHIAGAQWWTDYQPVSYNIVSKRGDRTQFQKFVSLYALFVALSVELFILVWSTPATLLEWESSQVYNPQDFKTAFLYVT